MVERVSAFAEQLDRLTAYCKVYRQALRRRPEWAEWLEREGELGRPFGPRSLQRLWEESDEEEPNFPALRRFRLQLSLRIALREINELAPVEETLRELSDLAEFCLGKAFGWALEARERKLGRPWNEAAERPAELCVLGFGKLGGRELNFCSDVDLSFLYEGEGHCVRGGKRTATRNADFFAAACREAVREISARTEDGFLYNVDLRLRPEGDQGPLAMSLDAMEGYYFARGQTWERLALLRARPVAGSRAVGEEFLEIVHPFRYPRHPPERLAEDIARLKERAEGRLRAGGRLDRDIKTGYGGIREIEFFAQALQVANAGRFPFLQTESTREALEQLRRYESVSEEDYEALSGAYRLLRLVENRLQMEEERQVHALPESAEKRAALAASFGLASWEDLEADLTRRRREVRRIYDAILPDERTRRAYREWFAFFAGEGVSEEVRAKIERWFGDVEASAEALRRWALGAADRHVAREQVQLFLDVAAHFDQALAPLADPLATLERLNKFAGKYGARLGFLKTCGQNPQLFEVLCRLFDRSRFAHELLCRNPEIFDELVSRQLRRRKPLEAMEREIGLGPEGDAFPRWLWLYVKAEQVRVAMNRLLDERPLPEVEEELTWLAEAAVGAAMRRVDPEGELAVVGLGKFGGAEMTIGSDIDLLLLGPDAGRTRIARALEFARVLGVRSPLGPTLEVDLRLRPYGSDGPLVTTLEAFRAYHRKAAHPWERQILARARPICGDRALLDGFERLRGELVWGKPLDAAQLDAVAHTRARAIREKGTLRPRERAFKNGPGGLADIEFLVQVAQLQRAGEREALRARGARQALRALEEEGLLGSETARGLFANYEFLREVEFALRLESNTAAAELPEDARLQGCLARWLGFEDAPALLAALRRRLGENRRLLEDARRKLGIFLEKGSNTR